MTPATRRQLFTNAVRHLGIIVSMVDCAGQTCPFIHFDDVSKAQERATAALAKEYGLTIEISDKGAIFQ
jgi:hypothetical protein